MSGLVAQAPVFGREAEIGAVAAFLDGPVAGGSALILDGEAGAGKTTLWRAGVELARARGRRVLEARPVAVEAQMAFAALSDLLQDVLDEVLDGLAPPQADALRVALLRQRARGAPPDERAVGLGLLNAFRVLGDQGPLLVAIDDIQWLDPASAIVLAFACRRLHEEPVQLLATCRSGEPVPLNPVDDTRVQRVGVGPLSLGAVHRLLHARLDLVLARPVLRRVHEVAGGNPFFALELGRALRRSSAEPTPNVPLPVPEGLRELVRDRLGTLPRATREALSVAAAVALPTRALVAAASGDAAALEPAFQSSVLVADGDIVRFAHPLLASAAYDDLSPSARRELHGRLAELVGDAEERARHLALAATGPDESVARELEAAAVDARVRGSTATAADLMEHASRLSASERADDRHRRTVAAGRLSFAAGDTVRAGRLLEQAVASAPGGRCRAEALTALGRLLLYEGDQPGAADVCAEALEESAADAAVRADAGGLLAGALFFMREDLEAAARHAAAATEWSRRTTDPDLRANTTSMSALLQVVVGGPDAFETLAEAERFGAPSGSEPVIAGPSFHRALMLLWTGDAQDAARLLHGLRARALAAGDESSLPLILAETAVAEYHNGRWHEAARLADDGHHLALQTGQRPQEAFALAVRALVAAAQGRADDARESAAGALAITGDRAMAVARIHAEWALAILDLSLGRPEHVADRLSTLRRRQLGAGVSEPGLVPFMAEDVEAAIALGRTTDAEAVLDWLEERGRTLDRPSALAAAARGRALLAGTRGQVEIAIDACQRALAEHGRSPVPFETARTLLILGALQRRAKQRSVARGTLGRAVETFEQLGAELWAERARDELSRIGGRRSPDGVLTPAERRVADLVADGRSNKEIAAVLFVTPKTVETQLSRMYAKLGVHSRTALARRLGDL